MRGSVTGDTHFWFSTYSPLTDNFLSCNKVLFLYNLLLPSEGRQRRCIFAVYQEKSCPLGGELHVSNATGAVLSEENFLSGRAWTLRLTHALSCLILCKLLRCIRVTLTSLWTVNTLSLDAAGLCHWGKQSTLRGQLIMQWACEPVASTKQLQKSQICPKRHLPHVNFTVKVCLSSARAFFTGTHCSL